MDVALSSAESWERELPEVFRVLSIRTSEYSIQHLHFRLLQCLLHFDLHV